MRADPLAPVRSAMAAMAARPELPPLTGLAPDLTITDPAGWTSSAELVSGAALDGMLAAAARRWDAAPHAAAALAWKSYSYWVALPAVLGYVAARRVPLLRSASVAVRWRPRQPFLTVGLVPTVEVAVLPSDPLASATPRNPGIAVVPHEEALIAAIRAALVDEHLAGVIAQIRARLRVGQRTLWGSVASGVAHAVSRAAHVVPGPALGLAHELLAGLDLADLVEVAEKGPGQTGLAVRRHTCCLAFTLPEPKICTDCCLR